MRPVTTEAGGDVGSRVLRPSGATAQWRARRARGTPSDGRTPLTMAWSSPGLGVAHGGEARCHTRLTCGDGDVPGFEYHGTRCLLDFWVGNRVPASTVRMSDRDEFQTFCATVLLLMVG